MMLSLYRGKFHRQDAKRAKTGTSVGASLAKPATVARATTGRASATPTWRAWRLGGALLLLCNMAAFAATNAPMPVVELKRTYDDAPTGVKDNLPLKLAWSNVVFTVDEGFGGAASIGICRVQVFQRADMSNAVASVVRERDGGVMHAWLTDLDGDGRPDIFVWIECAGSGAYGTLEAFTFDGKKLVKFFVPPLLAREAPSYHGHDWFEIKDGKLLTGFPAYSGAEPNESHNLGGEARFELDVKNKCWKQIIEGKKQP
ncbi:MAG: hypothetical protein NTY53_10845 [Kiritimatiellaeota bacterium]|nr:hypothetical protein [Kiritimatiellota bacterium]